MVRSMDPKEKHMGFTWCYAELHSVLHRERTPTFKLQNHARLLQPKRLGYF